MKKKLLNSMRVLLVAALLGVGTSAWAQITTWTFVGNTDVWAASGVTLNGGAQYDENANAVTTGGVTFTGTEGFVSTAKGIGFNATGSTTDENISIVVPAGYKASVSVLTSGNRTVVGSFGETTQTFNANWASSTKEFNNAEGITDVTLYLYCAQNPGGSDQKKAPFLESIVLTDMTAVASHSWTANAVATIEGVATTIKTYSSEEDVLESSNYTVVVDKVILYNGVYYELNDEAFTANVYGKIYTMGTSDAVHNISYTKVENVAFYGEIEDIYSTGSNATKQTGSAVLSNGGGYSAMSSKGGYVKAAFNVASDGIYTVIVGMNNTNDSNRGFNYSIDDADASATITVTKNSAHVQNITGQYLAAGNHTIQLNITYSLTPVFDYLLVIRTGDATVPATITSTGWATLYTPYALDFSGVTGLTAYTAAVADNKVTLTEVTDVPAGTGVVLKGDADTYNIPVAASSETAKGDLLGSATDATAYNAIDGYTLYMLKKVGEKAQFVPVTSGSIAAGKAYLKIAAATARNLDVTFADEATGISAALMNKETMNNKVYNLKGQRVAQPTKGLYIVNGKKVIK